MLLAIRSLIHRFRAETRGSLLIETAFAVPIVAMMAISGAEFARYTMLHQKVDRVTATMGDLVSQAQTIADQDFVNLFAAVDQVMLPFELGADGVILVSSISIPASTPGGTPIVNWQKTTGSLSALSKFGVKDGPATFPAGFSVRDGETVIVSETYYNYTPFFYDELIGPSQLYKVAFFRPRLSRLEDITPPPSP